MAQWKKGYTVNMEQTLGHLLALSWWCIRDFPTIEEWATGRYSGVCAVVRSGVRSGDLDGKSIGRWFSHFRNRKE